MIVLGFLCFIEGVMAINGWFKMDSYVSTREKLLSEIEKVKPDVVVVDLNLYARIDGIQISRVIRSRFNVSVMYF